MVIGGLGWLGYMVYFFLFILGAIVGSFLNVVVERLPRAQFIIWSRSQCPGCKKVLAWRELVPLVSFFILKRRCSKCRAPISWRYLFGEALTAVSWSVIGGILLERGSLLTFGLGLGLVTLLVLLLLYDARHQLLPDRFLLPAFGLAVGWAALGFNPGRSVFLPLFDVGQTASFLFSAAAAGGAFLFFLFLYILTRGQGMGLGDVKLSAVLGFMAGGPAILDVLLLAFGIGAITGIMYIALGRKTLRSPIAFGPFLIGAALFVLGWQLYGS